MARAPRDTEALLDRVRKLLALATSNNVHEAAAAAAAAQALIERHHLADLLADGGSDGVDNDSSSDGIDDGSSAPLEQSRRLRRFKVVLATVLAEQNGCVAWTSARGADTALCVAGRPADRAVTAALYAWLVVRIEWLSATHGAGRDRKWHEAFRIGATETIAARLAAPRAEDANVDADVDANVDVDRAAVGLVRRARTARKDAVERFLARNTKLERGRSFAVDAHGYRRGRAAGADADVDGVPVRPTR